MQILKFDKNSPEWLEGRKRRIMGSKVHDIIVRRGNGKKMGFYQLVADHLAIDDGETSSTARGHLMEEQSLDYFEELTGKQLERDCGMWVSDVDENIAISPDAAVESTKDADGNYTEAVETKSFGSARHIQAVIENQIPSDYMEQAIQYFVVNDKLQKLYFIFYDPRVTAHPLHIIELDRSEIEDDIAFQLAYEIKTLAEVNEVVERLSF